MNNTAYVQKHQTKPEWKKPVLCSYKTSELVCKVKACAWSAPGCESGDQVGEEICKDIAVENAFGGPIGDLGGEVPCMALAQCLEVGPLFGCDYDLACSTMLPVL